jgi:hypothetical protein
MLSIGWNVDFPGVAVYLARVYCRDSSAVSS